MEDQLFMEEMFEGAQLVFDKTRETGCYPIHDSTDNDEDNLPHIWLLQRRMVPNSSKVKYKVDDETPRKSPITKDESNKFIGDTINLVQKLLLKIKRKGSQLMRPSKCLPLVWWISLWKVLSTKV